MDDNFFGAYLPSGQQQYLYYFDEDLKNGFNSKKEFCYKETSSTALC